MLDCSAPKVRVRINDILVDVTNIEETWKGRSAGSSQGTKVVWRYRDGREAGRSRLNRDDRIRRGVLDHVECNVAKVTFVRHPVSPAEACLAVAEHIPRNSYSRSKIVLVRFPQGANRAVDCALHGSIRNLLR